MHLKRSQAVSPIIATLLLIAITVAAGIVVYVFVNGIAGNLTSGGGQQTTEHLQMQSYNFALNPGTSTINCGCSTWLVQIYLVNSGSASTTISAVYFNGVLLTLTSPADSNNHALAANTAFTAASNSVVSNAGTTGTCAAPTGVSVADNICFTVTGAQTTYSAGAVGQVVITFNSAQTSGTTGTVKIVSSTGGTSVFTVTSGRAG